MSLLPNWDKVYMKTEIHIFNLITERKPRYFSPTVGFQFEIKRKLTLYTFYHSQFDLSHYWKLDKNNLILRVNTDFGNILWEKVIKN